ncbi:MAG: Ig-like domain repeat protein [Methanobrevibacter sp.]|nr:Ig-like domain repeat protein [Methanobrevibacter sp.]
MTNERIAKATANVHNGRATTSSLVYESGKNRSSLVPGNDYTVTGVYQQNDKYKEKLGTATLRMLKCPTTLSISGNTEVNYGDSITLTITVLENKNHTLLSRGTVSVYDGNECIQSNYAITGNSTTITFVPPTAGTHDVYAIYHDSGVEYNSSNSNHLEITVSKLNSNITNNTDSILLNLGDSYTFTGTLSDSKGTLSSQNIHLVDYDNSTILQTATTNNNGEYSITYTPQNRNVSGNNVYLKYNGDDNHNGTSKSVGVTIRHETNLSVADETKHTDDIIDITALAVDENKANVTTGTVDWLIFPEHQIELTEDEWSYGKFESTTIPDASLIAPTITNGELSTGRGNVVYYNTALPSDLSEYTLRVKCHGTRLYNRIGISTITTNNDSTITIDTSKAIFAKDLVGAENDDTTYDIEFKFLNSICYVFVDGNYTGRSMEYSSVSDDLYLVAFSNSQYGGSLTPVVIESLSYVDCVDLNTIKYGEDNDYSITKYANKVYSTFTTTFPFEYSSSSGSAPVVNQDGSLKVGTGWLTDWFYYENDEDWIVEVELKINTLNTSSLGIHTDNVGDGHNMGIWNIHGKWIDFNDNTDNGNTRYTLDDISYGNGSTLKARITKNGQYITWQITDENNNTHTEEFTNFTQTRNTRCATRCNGATTDIDLLNYTRLTKIEKDETGEEGND